MTVTFNGRQIHESQLAAELKKAHEDFLKKEKEARVKALASVGLQLLNNIIVGSPAANVTPPIKQGFLRGSGSVFVGSQLIGQTENYDNSDANSNSETNDENEIHVVFGAAYAERMENTEWKPGPASKKAGNTGNHYAARHATGDAAELIDLFTKRIAKELGT